LLFCLSHCPWQLPAAHTNPLRHTTGHRRYNFATGLPLWTSCEMSYSVNSSGVHCYYLCLFSIQQ
jgi:hypothetical protein